jgi:signal transduction histidine kinase
VRAVTSESKARILLVDDDPRNLAALDAVLSDLGILVAAPSGEAALRQLLEHEFAVVLLDARMPGMDGFEVARLIRSRARSRHTPIMFLTGAYEDMPSVFRGYEAGAVDYIVKPLNTDILRSKLRIFIDLYDKSAVLAREIAERKLIEARLRASEDSLRGLTARLESVLEEERTRISREIHDELGQALTGLKMDVTWLLGKLRNGQKPFTDKLNSMGGLIDETIQSVRRIATGLRPELLDEAGLAAAISWQTRDFQMRTGIRCKTNLPADEPAVHPEHATGAFRVFQEVLTNVARHANATRVDVLMKKEGDGMVLEVKDNGSGIKEPQRLGGQSLGLLGMRERVALMGGEIEIAGKRGKGTRVTIRVPLQPG